MRFKFFLDGTGAPHIYKHAVSDREIVDFFTKSKYFQFKRKDGSFEAFAKIPNGRYLQVAYRKESDNVTFIITAYDIEDKEMIHAIEDNL